MSSSGSEVTLAVYVGQRIPRLSYLGQKLPVPRLS